MVVRGAQRLGMLAALTALAMLLAFCRPLPSAAPTLANRGSSSATEPGPAAGEFLQDAASAPSPAAELSERDAAADAEGHDANAGAADAAADSDTPGGRPQGEPPWELTCLAKYYAATPARHWSQWTLVTAAGERVYYAPIRNAAGMQLGARDIFIPAYIRGPLTPILVQTPDPGTNRVNELFAATYGRDTLEIHERLRLVDFFGTQLRIHERARPALIRVIAKIAAAKALNPAYRAYLEHLGGTYNHRFIAGTQTLSPHAFGIAIDLSTWHANYWRTDALPPGATHAPWKNAIPSEIVDAFESEGFIWGGRWYHFDTMHFEYRPELLDPACKPPAQGDP
jgi:hypothetical protein